MNLLLSALFMTWLYIAQGKPCVKQLQRFTTFYISSNEGTNEASIVGTAFPNMESKCVKHSIDINDNCIDFAGLYRKLELLETLKSDKIGIHSKQMLIEKEILTREITPLRLFLQFD